MKIGTRFIRWGTNGAPDLFALRKQVYECFAGPYYETALLGLEIKAGKDIQSNAQKVFQENFEAHGGTYIIVRKTEDLDEYI